MEIDLLIHGYSKSCKSEFMQYISKSIKDQGHTVYELNLDYIKNGEKPSNNLSKELFQLKNTIQDLKDEGYKEINLIGKSLGGILCLNPEIANDNPIKKIIILGFPFILGFPPDVNILTSKPLVKNPQAKEMYIQVFNKVENVKKINIIQGLNDLLAPPQLIDDFMRELTVKPHISYLQNSSHGFKPITKETSWKENLSAIKNILESIL